MLYDRENESDAGQTRFRGTTRFLRLGAKATRRIQRLAVAILLISCIEVSNFDRDPVTYSVFNIIFEVVSSYGCVGISTGLLNETYSFSRGCLSWN